MNKIYIAILLCISQDIFISWRLSTYTLFPPIIKLQGTQFYVEIHWHVIRYARTRNWYSSQLRCSPTRQTSPSTTLLFSVLPFSSRLLESSRDTADSSLLSKLKAFRSSSNARYLWVCFCLVVRKVEMKYQKVSFLSKYVIVIMSFMTLLLR